MGTEKNLNIKYNLEKFVDIYILDESNNNGFFSGNKYRKLSYILRNFNNAGILTCGSKFSNHCIATAYYSKRLKTKVILLILSEEKFDIYKYPNIKLAEKLGAEIVWIKTSKATEKINYYKEKYSDYLWIPAGGHTREGMLSYFDLTKHIFNENKELYEIEWILLPYGTGTTALGILKAINELNKNIKVIGVSVSRNKKRCLKAALDFADKNELNNLQIIDKFSGKYGKLNDIDKKYQDRFFHEYEIYVDPIYNVRSIRYFYEMKLKKGLIVNTGGEGNLFL